MKKQLRLCFFFIGSLLALGGGAQQSGYQVRNYTPKEYGGFNQVWCVAQDKAGIIYFGTSTVVMCYNGTGWSRVPVRPGVAVRSMCMDTASDRLYVGSVGEFGYLDNSPGRSRNFVSLLNLVDPTIRDFQDVNKTFKVGEKIIFQSERAVFIYDGKKVLSIPARTSFALSFVIGNRFLVKQRGVGIMELSGDSLRLLKGTEQIVSEAIPQIIPWKRGKLLLISGDSGFNEIDETNPNEVSVSPAGEKDTALINAGPLGACWLGDTEICVYTRSGMFFYDRDLRLKVRLGVDDGLGDASVSSVLIDRENNIWLGTMNGLSRISYGAPDRYYNRQAGFDGVFNCSVYHKGLLYVGTGSRIYVEAHSREPGKLLFAPIDMLQTEIWNIYSVGEDLFATSSNGLLRVTDKKAVYLTGAYCNSIAVLPGNKNEILVAEKNGVRYLVRDASGNWKEKRFIPSGSREFISVSDMREIPGKPGSREVWLTTRLKEICRLSFNVNDTITALRVFLSDKNFICPYNISPVSIGDSVYFWTNYLAMRYIPHLDDGGDGLCFGLAPDVFEMNFGNRIFLHEPDPHIFSSPPGLHGIRVPVPSGNRYSFADLQCSGVFGDDLETCYTNGNGLVWLASTNALVRYNLAVKNKLSVSYTALIYDVTIGDSVRYHGSGFNLLTNSEPLTYGSKRFVFSFAAPFFDHENETTFSYKLDGYDTAWSEWSDKTQIQFSNLSEGDYIFRVKARNVFGIESQTAEYRFTILPPWYRTSWAYLLYAFGFAGVFWGGIRISARRLRKQKEKLEVIVSERTAEVVHQKQQIEVQKAELESAYTDIQSSIHYAKRIQEAILPVNDDILHALPDSFILFRPRDIVSGDFYWMVKRGDFTWLACVDCTGHGVPGAFMSMIGNTLLNEIVLEKNIESPEKILDLLHIRIRQALRQDAGGETRDGMDISLCLVDQQKSELFFAGANRALWIIRNKELIVLPPDKFSIGGDQGDKERHFTLQKTTLAKGDCIYLSSDGYADQFGGPKGKKFMVKKFQELLLNIHNLPMQQQGEAIKKAFDEWKNWPESEGNKKFEQVDDVLVIGFCIN